MSPFSRRAALAALGLGALAPIVQLRNARAGAGAPKKRLLVWFTSCGTDEASYRPTGGETDFVLGPILQPLEAYRDQLLVFGPTRPGDGVRDEVGISIRQESGEASGGHMCQRLLTGAAPVLVEGNTLAGGPSVDQVVAQRIAGDDFLPSLELGVRSQANPDSYLSYTASAQPLPFENSPHAAFDRVFAGLATPDPAVERRKARRRAALDFAHGELSRVRRFAGTEDRLRIESHQQSIADIRSRLEQTVVCDAPQLAVDDPGAWSESWNEFDHVGDVAEAQVDIMATALACGITHVGTLAFGYAAANLGHPHLDVPDWLHTISHETGPDAAGQARTAELVRVHRWYNELLVRLLDKLAATPESDGSTALDHTLVLAVNELSHGVYHTHQNMPFFLVGTAGEALRTGRYVRTDRSHGDLLLSVCHAMGLDDLDAFGEPSLCNGPVPGLT